MLRWLINKVFGRFAATEARNSTSAPLTDRPDLAELVRLLQEADEEQVADGEADA